MSSVNKQSVSVAVLLLPIDSLFLHQTRKCHLSADSCLCYTHTGIHRESPTAPHPSPCFTMLSADPPNLSSPWQHFTVYLNSAGAQCVTGKLLHFAPFREDLSPGKENNEAISSLVVQGSPFLSTWWQQYWKCTPFFVNARIVKICRTFNFF